MPVQFQTLSESKVRQVICLAEHELMAKLSYSRDTYTNNYGVDSFVKHIRDPCQGHFQPYSVDARRLQDKVRRMHDDAFVFLGIINNLTGPRMTSR